MKILLISNGHGEDLNGALISDALRQVDPTGMIAAFPLVGQGQAYRQRSLEILSPLLSLPSGGLVYGSALSWWRDITGGLVGLTVKQFRALKRCSAEFDLVVAVGDSVPLGFAYLSDRPFVSVLVANSSYYEGRLRLAWTMRWWLTHRRCVGVLTRDNYTAQDLQRQGIKAQWLGYPMMDAIAVGEGETLPPSEMPCIALLPGSRVPEALQNLRQLLPLCEALGQARPVTCWGALVGAITPEDLQAIAQDLGWDYQCFNPGQGVTLQRSGVTVYLAWQRFAAIIHQADLAIGMAGTAVEQVVGLGKPVVQIPGYGPQFTYRFAEAQMRLLGPSVTTPVTNPDDPALIPRTVAHILEILDNGPYQQTCRQNGQERVGPPGGSLAIAELIQTLASQLY